MNFKQSLFAVGAAGILAVSALAAVPAQADKPQKPATPAAAPDFNGEYAVDVAHAHIGFTVKHLVISTTHGRFRDFAGTVNFDAKDIAKSSVNVTIKAASIDTDIPPRDKHLKGPDFFDVEKYPEITFKSTSVKKSGKGLVVNGDFTMHGVTKPISIPFTISGPIAGPGGKARMGISGKVQINRQDYGVSWNKKLDNGGLAVSDLVDITLDFEAVKK